MKKIFSLVILSFILIASIGFISAAEGDQTVITGKIYNSDYSAVVSGANVQVDCGGNVLDALSDASGSYKVQYDEVCVSGDELTVDAEKDGLTGSKTSTLRDSESCAPGENCLIYIYSDLDVAVVNVPLVPEFGAAIASLTVLGALGVFFIVRRK